MNGSIQIVRRLTGLALIVGAMATPVAQTSSGFTRSPDAIDRALAAEQAQKIAAIDAGERALLERPTLAGRRASGPDAFERALITHADAIGSRTASMPGARQRTLAAPLAASSPTLAPSSFDWGDFGLGAGAGIGLMLVLVGFGALTQRRRQEGMTTA